MFVQPPTFEWGSCGNMVNEPPMLSSLSRSAGLGVSLESSSPLVFPIKLQEAEPRCVLGFAFIAVPGSIEPSE